MISIEALTKAQQLSPQDKLEQHITKIINLPSKNMFGQPYVPLQEVLAWRTKALAIVKELKDA